MNSGHIHGDEPLREKLLFDKDSHDKQCGVTITRDLGNCDCNKEELWQLVMAEKDRWQIEAKLNLLDGLWYCDPSAVWTRSDGKRMYGWLIDNGEGWKTLDEYKAELVGEPEAKA